MVGDDRVSGNTGHVREGPRPQGAESVEELAIPIDDMLDSLERIDGGRKYAATLWLARLDHQDVGGCQVPAQVLENRHELLQALSPQQADRVREDPFVEIAVRSVVGPEYPHVAVANDMNAPIQGGFELFEVAGARDLAAGGF